MVTILYSIPTISALLWIQQELWYAYFNCRLATWMQLLGMFPHLELLLILQLLTLSWWDSYKTSSFSKWRRYLANPLRYRHRFSSAKSPQRDDRPRFEPSTSPASLPLSYASAQNELWNTPTKLSNTPKWTFSTATGSILLPVVLTLLPIATMAEFGSFLSF